uniref:Uncharacterized protein n=1 Tax=Anguilla anguilla TaxID=7936 RepID=A0A0E9W528_ANGAN
MLTMESNREPHKTLETWCKLYVITLPTFWDVNIM